MKKFKKSLLALGLSLLLSGAVLAGAGRSDAFREADATDATNVTYTINKTAIISGIEQPVKTETVTEGETLADLDTAIYGYTVNGYSVEGGGGVSPVDAATYKITGDADVTIYYDKSGTHNSYAIDYSAVSAFGDEVYIHYWRNASEDGTIASAETAWPGIKVAAGSGHAIVDIPEDADGMILNDGQARESAVQSTEISFSGATQKFVLSATPDASQHYGGTWGDGLVVLINKDIYTVLQDPVIEPVASGTTLAQLTSIAVYGWYITNYEIGGEYVEGNHQITAPTAVTVNYSEVDGSMSYTIDFTASPIPEENATYYAHIWKNDAAGNLEDSSDIKLPITAVNMVTVVIPPDATGFRIWNSPDEPREWQTDDIVATGLLYDAFRIDGIDETSGNYYGHWDSVVDEFLTFFFTQTNICVADGSTDTAALAKAWALIKEQWGYLTLAQLGNIKSATPDYSAEAVGTIGGMLARYDTIVIKYSGTVAGITDFMGRNPTADGSLFVESEIAPQESARLMIILIAGVILIGFGTGLLIKRRRKA